MKVSAQSLLEGTVVGVRGRDEAMLFKVVGQVKEDFSLRCPEMRSAERLWLVIALLTCGSPLLRLASFLHS